MIGNILIKGVSFLSLPIFTRLMSVSDYGLYNTYVAYEAILTIIIGFGLYGSIKNALIDYEKELDRYISTIITIVLGMTFIVVIIGAIISKYAVFYTGFSISILSLLVVQSFGSVMLNVLNNKLALDYKYKKYLVFAGINTLLNVFLSILLMYTLCTNNTLLARCIGSATPLLLIGIYILIDSYKKTGGVIFDFDKAKYGLIIGAPLVWHYLSQQIAAQFDRIMITYMVDSTSNGIYSFIYTIANIFTIIFYSTDNVWGVWFFKKMKAHNYLDLKKGASSYMKLMSFICISMMFVSKEIIRLMGTSDYIIGANLFIPIIIGMYFLYLYTIPVQIEYYYKETKYIAIMTFISAIVNLVLNYFAIKKWGYFTAAFTTALSYLILFIGHWIISSRMLKNFGDFDGFEFYKFLINIFLIIAIGILVVWLNSFVVIKYCVFFIFVFLFCCFCKDDIIKVIKANE